MKPLISVVVPVYNVEAYLRQCLDSIVRQTYKELDIILVDDGSSDGSPRICDEYAAADPRIRVLHRSNGGPSAARNAGTAIAAGEYVLYIDSDDWVDTHIVENLCNAVCADNADISVCRLKEFPDGEYAGDPAADAPVYKTFSMESKEAIESMLYQKSFDTSPCAKLIKTELCRRHRFPEGRIFEDLATIYRIFFDAGRVEYLDCAMYYYRARQGSIMHQGFSAETLDEVTAADQIMDFIEECCPELLPAAKARKFSSYSQVLRWMPPDDELTPELRAVQQKLWEYIRSYRASMLADTKARRKNRIAALLAFAGRRVYQKI